MVKETRRFEWEAFSKKITAHYENLGFSLEMRFPPDAEGLSKFVIHEKDKGTTRTLSDRGAYEEIRAIFFPNEPVIVLSVYKPRHGWFGQEYVYVAIEREETAETKTR